MKLLRVRSVAFAAPAAHPLSVASGRPILLLGAVATLVTALGCRRTPEPEPREGERATAPAAGHERPSDRPAERPAARQAAADLAWEVPAGWETVPNPSAMRKATYRIPKASGDDADAEMSVSQAGGDVDANVNRWVSQFEGGEKTLKRETRTVNGLSVTIVEVRGTYASGMPGGPTTPKADQALLGAIVPTDPAHFFKLVGPEKTVLAARPKFDELVGSFRGK